ncbi:capsid assembly scaffolding protein Gp46 family protein [Secundilactobacillus kimchicus]|uniref:capsid assembly scaffolding protein Gp46 family protein n=1 Tax=Secundilactobacillus kimchicus TaxID=528209 RepID=UPI0024A8AC35|nr:DUF4355 domain-containing protein [Secundilactobacillus kimchicus]
MFFNSKLNGLPMNLQMFAEETGGGAGGKSGTPADVESNEEPHVPETDDDGDGESDDEQPKTYTQEQLEAAVKERAKRAEKLAYKKGIEAGKSEAQKLADMGDDEKKDYAIQKLQEQLDAANREKEQAAMMRTANDRLQEAGVNLSSERVEQYIVGADANETNERINDFTAMYNDLKAQIKADLLRNESVPKAGGSANKTNEEDIGSRIAKQFGSKSSLSDMFKAPK